ncbi:hypothetical protein ACIP98_40650 [Streptomyces sp. NPDC088354]|uniref:hypothetical protein n=1 Tax=Streptomyces sp. NPDC088354 TaxID=3365856 RepID=UPI0038293306
MDRAGLRSGAGDGQRDAVVKNATSRQAAHPVWARIDSKYMLGLGLEDTGFNCTPLAGFRDQRLTCGLKEKLDLPFGTADRS